MFRGLAPYIFRHRKQFIFGVIVIFLATFSSLLGPPVFVRYAIDALGSGKNVTIFVLLIILSSLISNLLYFAMRRLIITASRQITNEIRMDVFAKLTTLDQTYFHKMRTGDLMNRMTSDINAIHEVIGFSLMHGTSNSLRLIISVIAILSISLSLGLLILVTMPVIVVFAAWIMRIIDQLYTRMQEQASTLAAKAQENFTNIRLIKGYAIENREIKEFKALSNEYRRRVVKLELVDGPAWSSLEFLLSLIFSIGLMIVAKPIISGELSLGQFVQFSTYLFNLTWPLFSLGEIVGKVQRGFSSWQRLDQIYKAKSSIDDSRANFDIKSIKGSIKFDKVSLVIADCQLLNEIDLEISAGTVVGITGRTGSGKSLLANLITRQVEPTKGCIYIDDFEIKTVPLNILRTNIGLVSQELFLFSQTIEENISFGLKNIDQNTVSWAANIANLTKEINSFENGFSTMLGERGITLSGGQRQRTALARAIAKNPNILILDDALSAIDAQTESEILKKLREIFPERTVILISHRISTLKHADKIFLLSQGSIIEEGSHQELIAKGGFYAKLEEKQRFQGEGLDE